jgi:hypothetical protein
MIYDDNGKVYLNRQEMHWRKAFIKDGVRHCPECRKPMEEFQQDVNGRWIKLPFQIMCDCQKKEFAEYWSKLKDK